MVHCAVWIGIHLHVQFSSQITFWRVCAGFLFVRPCRPASKRVIPHMVPTQSLLLWDSSGCKVPWLGKWSLAMKHPSAVDESNSGRGMGFHPQPSRIHILSKAHGQLALISPGKAETKGCFVGSA